MKPHRYYIHAPITEALIDIQLELPSGVSIEQLREIHQGIAADYPKERKRIEVRAEFTGGEQVGATARQIQSGFYFSSSDDKQIVQMRRDGFTFSRLAPYETWERLRDEARRLWPLYKAVTQSLRVRRIAVRYINQINIPLPMRDFADYLRTFPQVSPDLHQGLSGYLMRLEQPQPDLGATLVLTQAMVPPAKESVCSVVLDIDVFAQEVSLLEDEKIWGLLELLRDRKNEIFEACITDETRRLIE